MNPPESGRDAAQQSNLEMAYVLFMDIVGYSRMPTDVQQETLHRLQSCVQDGSEFRKAQAQKRLVSLPTGDGMALAFFGNPESSVRCAVETTQALKREKEIPLRMGLHAGPVHRVTDINANQNVAGDGINIAQRVMDCGDSGHILVSKAQADVLRQLSGWMGALHDLGEVSVKHGVKVHVFNLLVEGTGNPAIPEKLGSWKKAVTIKGAATVGWKKWAVLVASILVVGVAISWKMRPVHAYRPRLALLGFADQQANPENDWLSRSLTEDLATELESSEKVVTIPGETVSRAMAELALTKQVSYGQSTMSRVRKYLDCDFVVYGSFYDIGKAAGGQIQVNVRMQDARTGEMVLAFSESGSEDGLGNLTSLVGGRLGAKLGLPNPSLAQVQEMDREHPSRTEAQKPYARGLESLWKYDLVAATQAFQEVIKIEPTFPLAHSELAEAWMRQGYDERAKEEADKAKELSSFLTRESKLRVDASAQEMSSEWDEAAESYKALWRFVRERPEYAYRAADVQIRGGKAEAALATVADLKKQPGAMANNPIIDLREAEAYDALSRYKEAVLAANTAAEKAHVLGARMLEAEALWRECAAKLNLGAFDEAQAACERSQSLAKDIYPLMAARAEANLGLIARGRGKFADALAAEKNALEIAGGDVGSQRDAIGALQNMGIIQAEQGNHGEAVKSYEAALAKATETRNKDAMGDNYNNLATELQTAGDTKRALDCYAKSLDLAKEIKKTSLQVDAGNNLGSLQLLLGQLKDASENLEEALRSAEAGGFKDKVPSLLTTLGDIRLEQGNGTEAERNYQQAIAASGTIGDKSQRALAQISLSRMKLEAGDVGAAENNAKEAADEFQKEGMKEESSEALATLAESLAEEGKLEEASSALGQAKAAQPTDKTILLAVDRASIRLSSRQGKLPEARKTLEEAIKRATGLGYKGWELRLKLIECELGLDRQSGREQRILAEVEREADKGGYVGLQKRAAGLLHKRSSARG